MKPGIKLISESEGSGEPVRRGDTVKVLLNGWLNRGDCVQEDFIGEITLGSRISIPGIEYSLEGMKSGGKRKVKISPHLAYGNIGVEGKVPPNAILVYEIEILEIAHRA